MHADGRRLNSTAVTSWATNPTLVSTALERKGVQWYETAFKFSEIVSFSPGRGKVSSDKLTVPTSRN
jgi:hypothetical protein